MTITPGLRRGRVSVPRSKSHYHRLLIADYLGGGTIYRNVDSGESDDVHATARCLEALADGKGCLDCGESGSTLRFLMPVVGALGGRTVFTGRGRLPERPVTQFLDLLAAHGVRFCGWKDNRLELDGKLEPGEYSASGNVSSQLISGLLFALPLLDGDSDITLSSPLESRGYVDLTMQVVSKAGILVETSPCGYHVPGNQKYAKCDCRPEGCWSCAAFWFGMNALGSEVEVDGLDAGSAQPDRAVELLRGRIGGEIDISQSPDLFPVLVAVAGAFRGTTRFVNAGRLRLKESDRIAAMAALLRSLGTACVETPTSLEVRGAGGYHVMDVVRSFGDHRVAMAAAVAATAADAPVVIDDAGCAAKSYPGFFNDFSGLDMLRK
ncbi:MAG: 3-phosphoshikimate 1-carboxyvinyltransferase [Victivallaceae bacterium]|nr:3-phosphoshikimate 1-carboxyvinyltransferase [Victivallaceae bacterium]